MSGKRAEGHLLLESRRGVIEVIPAGPRGMVLSHHVPWVSFPCTSWRLLLTGLLAGHLTRSHHLGRPSLCSALLCPAPACPTLSAVLLFQAIGAPLSLWCSRPLSRMMTSLGVFLDPQPGILPAHVQGFGWRWVSNNVGPFPLFLSPLPLQEAGSWGERWTSSWSPGEGDFSLSDVS